MKVRIRRQVLIDRMAARNLSQNRWAQKLGISRGYLSMLLSGKRVYPGPELRRRLLDLLEVSYDELFYSEPVGRQPLDDEWGEPSGRSEPSDLPFSRPALQGDLLMTLWEDLRFSIRLLLRSPGFLAMSLLTLAIGIGANTAIFSFTNTLLWKPLPFPEPAELVFLNETQPDVQRGRLSVSYLNFRDWQKSSTSFQQMAAYDTTSLILQGGDQLSRRINGVAVSGDFFELLRIPPYSGTVFTEDEPGEAVAVLGYTLWQDLFGGDPTLLGKTIQLDQVPTQVIGVMPPNFRFPEGHDIWIPLKREPWWEERAGRSLDVIARLQPGVELSAAHREMDLLAEDLGRLYPQSNQGYGVFLVPFREENVGEDDQLLVTVLMGVTALVLLIACVNIAQLSLARTAVRRREMAIRSALGAGSWRLIRQLQAEALLLALVGGLAGVLLGKWAKDLLVYSMPDEFPYWMDFSLDTRVYLFAAGITLLSGLLFGLGPALQAVRSRNREALREARGDGTTARPEGRWLRSVLVVAEVCLAMVLLAGTGLLMQTYLNTTRLDLGYNPDRVLTFRAYVRENQYQDPQKRIRFYQRLLDEFRHLPGVSEASAASWLPLQGSTMTYLQVEGQDYSGEARLPIIAFQSVLPGYLRTVQTPLLEGRDFQEGDGTEGRRVAIVNERMARRYWPGQSALGKKVAFGARREDIQWAEVVGVAADSNLTDRTHEAMMAAYVPYAQRPDLTMTILVRSSGPDPLLLGPALRGRLHEVDPGAALARLETWQQVIRLSNWEETFFGWVFAVFSAIALLMAAFGLYGVVLYSGAQRRHEIGIRIAVGARTGDVLRLIFSSGMKMAGVGIALGLLGALLLGQVLGSLLVDVSPTDPVTLLATAAVLCLVMAAACWYPARRAASTDPIETLRS